MECAVRLRASAFRQASERVCFRRKVRDQVDHRSLPMCRGGLHRTRVERRIGFVFAHQLGTLGIGLIAQLSNHAQAKIQPCRHPSPRNPVTVTYHTRFGWNCTEPGQRTPARPTRCCRIPLQQPRRTEDQRARADTYYVFRERATISDKRQDLEAAARVKSVAPSVNSTLRSRGQVSKVAVGIIVTRLLYYIQGWSA